jgi:hypothetical protein
LAKPTDEGDPIDSGPLLRFIPNWDVIAWEYDRDRPSPRAWRRRAGEEYVSLYREADDDAGTSVEALREQHPDFAIFRVTVESLTNLGNVSVKYKPLKNELLGNAHVGAFGINRPRAEKLARDPLLTERLNGPAAAGEPPTSAPADDAPRDRWRGPE